MNAGLTEQLYQACTSGNLSQFLDIIYNDFQNEALRIITDEPSSHPGTPSLYLLHIASANGHDDVVRQLIELGADVNKMSAEGETPLSEACVNGHIDIVKLLVSKGAESVKHRMNESPVELACQNGHVDVVEFLINEKPVIIQKHGQYLLYIAALEGHLELVKLFIRKRVSINPPPISAENEDDRPVMIDLHSPLYGACLGKKQNVAKYLIENGAMVTVKIVEEFGDEFLGKVFTMFTRDVKSKRKTMLSFEPDPSISMIEAHWASKNIHSLYKGWFVNLSVVLTRIDVSNNYLQELPDELFTSLCVLEELDVSNNKLLCLPDINFGDCPTSLEKLFLQRNQLSFVPSSLFRIKTLSKVNLSHNMISTLDDEESLDMGNTWRCPTLKVLKLNNNLLTCLPRGIQSASGLVKLFVNNNKLKDFPMPWKCPLETLDISFNRLTEFSANIDMVWSDTLRYLNLSHNSLGFIAWSVCQLSCLFDLNVSNNRIKSLPPENSWKCINLHKLNLSHNKVSFKSVSEGQGGTLQRLFKTPSQDENQDYKKGNELPVNLFAPTLETLFLNHNCLQEVPLSICQLTNLIELDLSDNPDLKSLPPQLGNLRDCWQLRLNNLNLIRLPKHVRPDTMGVRPKDTLAYLRATLRKSVPYYRMKLMVVGIQGHGKTTLLAALKGEALPKNLSTVGIVIDEWNVQPNSGSWFPWTKSSDSPTITFSTWDLAGQTVYYAAHQMFLSPSTLYLCVWNVTLGEEGIESLRQWLLNIKARAPFSDVLIVGTHMDRLPKKVRESRLDKLRQMVMNKFGDSKGFPKIVGNITISATTGENVVELREMIYNKATKAKEQGENIIGKQVPLSYIQLQDSVIKEAQRRRESGQSPILLEEEILDLASKNKDNDILDHEELALATRFLHENGVLLHYNDQLRGLNTLYFIDPSWVCDLIASIVTVKERNNFVREGIMSKHNIHFVLKDPRFPPEFIPQYLQLMERFEIALSLDENRLLIPSMLPIDSPGMQRELFYRRGGVPSWRTKQRSKTFTPSSSRSSKKEERKEKCSSTLPVGLAPPEKHKGDDVDGNVNNDDDDGFPKEPVDAVSRNYQMAYIPSGFWSRLITRLMVSLQRWRTNEGIEENEFFMIYWRKGIGVIYSGGHFLVQSYRELVPLRAARHRFEEYEGVSIEVWSSFRDFSVMGFIVDQVDALISEWYPGLDDTDTFGYPLVRRLIPCPRCTYVMARRGSFLRRSCSLEYPTEHCGSQPVRPYNFTLPTCAAAAMNFSTINCPYHPDTVVSLDELIPDLLMTDLPRNLLVDSVEFSYTTDDESRLGGGGAGEVFRGLLREEEVAVKTFHSTRVSRYLQDSGIGVGTESSSMSSTAGSSIRHNRSEGSSVRRAGSLRGEFMFGEDDVEDELEKTKVVRAFWDLRQEVAVLCHLQHPCIVKLLGVCLHPLCFLLELAPHGSLANLLDELTLGREIKKKETLNPAQYESKEAVLGKLLTYRIAFQVASALWYLHDSDIIYRDLKADNILVWSIDEDDLVNVKLSDYGISVFATPQGVSGDEGTPGYQAPEIRTGIGYDEKVDIFSFAIFLYELISGVRPFRDFKSSVEIKKAIRRNVRPSLEDHDLDSQLPRLERLMVKSWHELPERRPNAEKILQEIQEPEFLCHCRVMPKPESGEVLEKITSVYGMAHSGSGSTESSFVLLWSRERSHRQYGMLNCDTGVFYFKDESCPGHRVLCMAKVGSRTWLGTEGNTIDIFGRRSSHRLPTTLFSFRLKAAVLGLLVQDTEKPLKESEESTEESSSEQSCKETSTEKKFKRVRVFASLSNGTLIIFSHSVDSTTPHIHEDVKLSPNDDDSVIKEEMTYWNDIQVINLGQSGSPVNCMVLTNEDTELWVSCDNKIIILDTRTLMIIKEIQVYSSRRAKVRKMVACDDRVWSIDRRSTKILQWDVRSHQLTHVFDLEVENPVMKLVCLPFSKAEGVDIGEEDAKRQGDTLPKRGRERSETGEVAPSSVSTSSEDKKLFRSGALKFRNSSGVSASEQNQAAQGTTEPVKMERNSDNKDDTVSSQADGVEEETVANSFDSGFCTEPSLSRTQNLLSRPKKMNSEDNAESDNPDTKTKENEATTITDEPNLQADEEIKTVDNNNESSFEFVDRSKVVVEAAKERKQSIVRPKAEAVSMASLKANPKSITRGPSMMKSRKRKSLRNANQGQNKPTNDATRPRLHVITGSVNKVMTILYVGGTLWVGRGRGDLVVVNVDNESNEYFYGEVIAVLKCDSYLQFYTEGHVHEVIKSGSNKIVCLRRVEPVRMRRQAQGDSSQSPSSPKGQVEIQDRSTERYQLNIWEAWGRKDFESFKSYHDRFDACVE
ncbi:leucine-rich repeat serine/threonine-protein kinase 1 [Exaiptasia diaphana]|uniref:non-specific serine/threonine protein kinase n=1 Tax=Exaiptasia diaphana TaxID=2652724 RepID=A0A913Y443_EXADI|nr:leucine-rich repeat serine/threonine-protein kinase 1 [Exaiptasia diaphana]KXJ22658.1 Leucine-rich repeat serine/threonine-protein kinase 1 [Exaiptasia diaphana]